VCHPDPLAIFIPSPTALFMLAIASAAFYLGVAPVTLRRYEKKGLIHPARTPGNHRRYSRADLDSLLRNIQETPLPHEIEGEKAQSVAIYTRVSQPIQKSNGDLNRQVAGNNNA
jgi:predicted site-specific integrase-resolvase